MNDIWKKTLKRFIYDQFAKDEVTEINKAVVETANNINPSVHKDNTEELVEKVPEESTHEKLLELKQEHKRQEK